jgi:hypothetical protein
MIICSWFNNFRRSILSKESYNEMKRKTVIWCWALNNVFLTSFQLLHQQTLPSRYHESLLHPSSDLRLILLLCFSLPRSRSV